MRAIRQFVRRKDDERYRASLGTGPEIAGTTRCSSTVLSNAKTWRNRRRGKWKTRRPDMTSRNIGGLLIANASLREVAGGAAQRLDQHLGGR